MWCGGMGGGILVSGARFVDEVSEGGEVIGIEGFHSLGEKAVEQSGGAGSDAPVPSSWWQELEETVEGMGGVLHDTGSFTAALCKENVQDGWERGTDDLCSCVHCPLEGLSVCCTAVPVPDGDAAGQHTLNCSPVECGEDGWRETCSFKSAQEVEPLLRLLG